MHIAPPSFPLSVATFDAALRTGHGRALRQVENYGVSGLEDKVIAACISCVSYDPQCEGSRAPWLFSIVERAQLQAVVLRAIEKATHQLSDDDHRDMDQRSALLKEFAAHGSGAARRLLYLSLTRLSHTADVIGADQIVELDGTEGLIFVARQLGRWVQADTDFWVDGDLIESFDDLMGKGSGLAVLEREASVDTDIASYLTGVRNTREHRLTYVSSMCAKTYTGSEIVAYAFENPRDRCVWFRQWGAKADDAQLEVVYEALLALDELDVAKRLLRCFGKNGVPRFDHRLLRWINNPDEQVQFLAIKAVASIAHDDLRQAGLRLITSDNIAMGIALLVHNFKAGDFSMCAGYLKPSQDVDRAHDLVGKILDLCEANPRPEALGCLLYVYEFSPCSLCRKRAVQLMIDIKIIPAWVSEESEFDADPNTRVLINVAN